MTRHVMTTLSWATVAVGLAAAAACGAGGSSPATVAQAAAPMSCEAIASLALAETTITLGVTHDTG